MDAMDCDVQNETSRRSPFASATGNPSRRSSNPIVLDVVGTAVSKAEETRIGPVARSRREDLSVQSDTDRSGANRIALWTKRSAVERKTNGNMKSGSGVDSMTAKKTSAGAGGAIQRRLRELIAALDRRVPHIERVDEAEIARAAAALRKKAVQRLTEVETELNGSN
jgi:hypothetical protein